MFLRMKTPNPNTIKFIPGKIKIHGTKLYTASDNFQDYFTKNNFSVKEYYSSYNSLYISLNRRLGSVKSYIIGENRNFLQKKDKIFEKKKKHINNAETQ